MSPTKNIRANKEQIIKMHVEQNMSAEKIGKEWGCTGQCIRDNLRKWGVSVASHAQRTKNTLDPKKDLIAQALGSGRTVRSIALSIGSNENTLRKYIKENNLVRGTTRKHTRSTNHGNQPTFIVQYGSRSFSAKNTLDIHETLKSMGYQGTMAQVLNALKYNKKESIARFGFFIQRSEELEQVPSKTSILDQFDMPEEEIKEALEKHYQYVYQPKVKRIAVVSKIRQILEHEGVLLDDIKDML